MSFFFMCTVLCLITFIGTYIILRDLDDSEESLFGHHGYHFSLGLYFIASIMAVGGIFSFLCYIMFDVFDVR